MCPAGRSLETLLYTSVVQTLARGPHAARGQFLFARESFLYLVYYTKS